jgi:hypothetical protein
MTTIQQRSNMCCGHWVVCPLIYGFWLLLWCLVVIELSVLWFTASDYSFGILWSLSCLSCDLRLLFTPLVCCGHWVVCPVIYGFWLLLWYLVVIELSVLWFTASDYSFGILWSLSCLSCDLQLLVTTGQTAQWPQYTKGVIRSRKSQDRQLNDHKIPKE